MSQSKSFGTQSRKSYVGLLLLTVCAFLTQGVLAAATDSAYGDNEVQKDNEFPSLVKRPAFFVGSRYGRSSGNSGAGGSTSNSGVGTSKSRRLIIVPRNDRFFLGSRYGKRSDEYLSPYEQSSLSLGLNKASLRDAERDSVEAGGDNNKGSSNSRTRTGPAMSVTMSCVYTGIRDFYRCSNVNTDELNHIMNRNDAMTLDSNSIASEDTNTNTNTK
ncbi:uncharacterized protein LOC117784232 [Drosophila innubila]|uniref:uncharacterized protein LOC117784232 n=1 Tax=Drosophila innubila TaxID=198719 RepID=UPI00148CFCDD|nr:uncharacterized protein LOC117784232 [Drosophila innubila]XP_034477796.1 uncharacterized protein LOC117784232 [Drosophila innubila]